MKTEIRAGSRVICVEGRHQGETGIVSSLARQYDQEDATVRWTIWFDNEAGEKIKTRLAWVREL